MSTVWIKGKNGTPEARQVMAGLNDGNRVEIISGSLAEGDSIIVGTTGKSAATTASNSQMPGFGGPGRR